MKTYVIREWTGLFKESVMVTDNVSELTAVKRGTDLLRQESIKSLEFYKKMLEKADNDEDRIKYEKDIKENEEYLVMLDNLIESFEVENETPISKYTIKEQKVDYVFNFDISKLQDEEILEKLNSIYPDKKLYMVPNFRGRISNRVTILGHNGNIVVTYK